MIAKARPVMIKNPFLLNKKKEFFFSFLTFAQMPVLFCFNFKISLNSKSSIDSFNLCTLSFD